MMDTPYWENLQEIHPNQQPCKPDIFLLYFFLLKWKRKSVVSDSLRRHGLYSSRNSPGQNTGVGSLSLLQGSQPRIKPRFPALRADSLPAKPQGESKNTGVVCHELLQGIFLQVSHIAGRLLYHLSHQGSPRTLEWIAYLFSRGSSWPRNRTGVSCFAGGFFTSWATCLNCYIWNEFLVDKTTLGHVFKFSSYSLSFNSFIQSINI